MELEDAALIIDTSSMKERNDILSDVGMKYQYAVTALYAVKFSIHENITDYRIYSSEKPDSVFDDIVIKARLKSPNEVYTSMTQVKYKATQDVDINKIFKEKTLDNIDDWREELEDSNVRFSIFSNSNISNSKKLSRGKTKYKFSSKVLGETDEITETLFPCWGKKCQFVCNPPMEAKYAYLFNNCYLCLEQPDIEGVKQELKKVSDIDDPDAIIAYVNSYFSNHALRKKGMTKNIFEMELQNIRFSRFIISTQVFREFSEYDPITAWNDITLSQDVTIINNSDNDIDIERNLLGYLMQKLNSLLGMNINGNTFKDENLRQQFHAKFETYFKTHLIRYYHSLPDKLESLLIEFWKIGVLPIILKCDEENDFEKYIQPGKKYIIIENPSRRSLSIPENRQLKIFRHMGDVTDIDKRDKLLEKVRVSLQGRQPTTLKYLTDGNEELIKTFSTADIIKLIKPRSLYLKQSCLEGHNNVAFFIRDQNLTNDSVMKKLHEIGDNIVINCHPDKIDEQIRIFENEFKYCGYTICQLERTENRLKLYQGDTSRLRSYFIDQYGQSLYSTKEGELFPIIGDADYFNERNYIPRSLRKSTIDMSYFDSKGKRICLVSGDAGTIPFSKIDVDDDKLELKQEKTFFVKVKEEERQRYWDKLSSLKCPIFDIVIRDNKSHLLRYKCSGNLRQYIQYDGDAISEEQFFEDIKNSKGITVLTGEPGMGKSSLVKSLYSSIEKYILFYDLTQYKHHRDRPVSFEDLLSKIFQKRTSEDHNNFLQELCNQKRLIVALDSYDEITSTPDVESSALEFIQNIAIRGIPIVICSRPVLSKSTEVCTIRTLKLEPLDNTAQGEYIENWDLRVEDLRNIPHEFTENPLFLKFLKVVAKDQDLFENFSRLKLYDEVISSKIKHSLAANCTYFDSGDVEEMKESFEELALLRLFGKDEAQDALVKISLKRPLTKYIRTGVIIGVDDNIPIFIHFTFVEYLVSQWLIRNLEKQPFQGCARKFYKKLLIDRHARILEIEFDQSSMQNAIVETKVSTVEKMLRDNPECLENIDRFNRTVLHIAAIHCRYHTHRHDPIYKILDKILKSMKNRNPDYIYKRDMSGMTWAEYVNKEVFENIVLNNLFVTLEVYLKIENRNVQKTNKSGVFPVNEETFEKLFKVVKWRCLSINIIRDLFFLQNYHNRRIRTFLQECERNTASSSELSWTAGRTDGLLAPLHVACLYNSLRMVQRLTEVECDVNITDQYRCTPLYYNVMQCPLQEDARRDDNLNITRLLLYKGANIAQPDNGCGTILYAGVKSRNIDVVKMLLEHASSTNFQQTTKVEYINMQNRDTTFPLQLAVETGDLRIVKLLLNEGANPNLQDKYGEISLHAAVNAGNLDIIQELLKRGANINTRNISNRAPLHFAVEKGNTEVLKMLLEQEQITIENDCVDAACFSAIFAGNEDIMSLLLDRVTNINVMDENYDTLLHKAVLRGKLNIADLLIKRGASKNTKNKWGNTPLYYAVETENKDITELLLQKGADPNIGNVRGNTPLHLAADNGNVEIAQLLLEYKAKMSAKNKREGTPFLFSVGQDNVGMVKLLIDQIEDWSLEKENPASLLREAVIVGNADIIGILLSKGLDTNVKFENGNTPLHVAVCLGKLDVIKLLVERGGDINCTNGDGQTPLNIAVTSKSPDTVKLLCPHGTNVD